MPYDMQVICISERERSRGYKRRLETKQDMTDIDEQTIDTDYRRYTPEQRLWW